MHFCRCREDGRCFRYVDGRKRKRRSQSAGPRNRLGGKWSPGQRLLWPRSVQSFTRSSHRRPTSAPLASASCCCCVDLPLIRRVAAFISDHLRRAVRPGVGECLVPLRIQRSPHPVLTSTANAVWWAVDGLRLHGGALSLLHLVCMRMHHGPEVTERCFPGDQ